MNSVSAYRKIELEAKLQEVQKGKTFRHVFLWLVAILYGAGICYELLYGGIWAFVQSTYQSGGSLAPHFGAMLAILVAVCFFAYLEMQAAVLRMRIAQA